MNPNDLMIQQQALINQAMQRSQYTMWAIGAIYLALFFVGVFVTYLFYARLRDIADELRKLRISFEMAEDRKARALSAPRQPPSASGEESFMPKPKQT